MHESPWLFEHFYMIEEHSSSNTKTSWVWGFFKYFAAKLKL